MAKGEQSETKKNGKGNTKTLPTQGKRWTFTLNNYKNEWLEQIEIEFKRLNLRYVWGEEIAPDTLTPHLQGYIESVERMRPSGIKWSFGKWNLAHWEKAKGTRIENLNYCTKDGKGLKTWRLNIPKNSWKKINPKKWQRELIDEMGKGQDDRTIRWIWEPEGATGKTTFQKYVYSTMDDVVVLGGKASDMKNGIIEYMKKNGGITPNIVLINVPRVSQDYVSFQGIEEIKDMFFYSGKYEGGMVCGENPQIYVFSNAPPDKSKMSKDRWKIGQIINDDMKNEEVTGESDELDEKSGLGWGLTT